MEFHIKGRHYNIELSEDKHTYAKIQSGVYYYSFPEDRFDKVIERLKAMEEEERRIKQEYDQDIDQVLAMVNNRKLERPATMMGASRPGQTKKCGSKQLPRTRTRKRVIKRPAALHGKKTHTGNKKMRLQAMFAALLIAGTIGTGIYGINHYIQYQKEYNEVSASVEGLTDEEIKEEIEDILKQEVRDATGEKRDEVEILQYYIGTDTKKTQVQVGDDVYTEIINYRDPISFGNTLKSNGIRDIISQANSAKDREELIKALIKAQRFSKDRDLEVDGDKLKEIKSSRGNEASQEPTTQTVTYTIPNKQVNEDKLKSIDNVIADFKKEYIDAYNQKYATHYSNSNSKMYINHLADGWVYKLKDGRAVTRGAHPYETVEALNGLGGYTNEKGYDLLLQIVSENGKILGSYNTSTGEFVYSGNQLRDLTDANFEEPTLGELGISPDMVRTAADVVGAKGQSEESVKIYINRYKEAKEENDKQQKQQIDVKDYDGDER